MDVYDIRKKKLLLLEAEAASLKAIGDAMVRTLQRRGEDRAPDYQNVLSQHKGKKPIGQRMARLIEEAMDKPRGWMDTLADVDHRVDATEASHIAMNITDVGKREAWLSLGRALTSPAKSPGNPYGESQPISPNKPDGN